MELVYLSPELRKHFGITSCHITYNDNDYIVMLKYLSDSLVIFSLPDIEIEDSSTILIEFPSVDGVIQMQLIVSCSYSDGVMLNVECMITGINKNDFLINFSNFIYNILDNKKRKEERILCTKKNLERLHLINYIYLVYKNREFKGIIKDISYSGIKILISPLLLQSKDDLFTFKLNFYNPSASFLFVNTKIIRNELFTFQGYDFAQIVFKLDQNIKYIERLNEYFNEREKTIAVNKK